MLGMFHGLGLSQGCTPPTRKNEVQYAGSGAETMIHGSTTLNLCVVSLVMGGNLEGNGRQVRCDRKNKE